MKYHRLTHEQFEALHQEFAVFLAKQGLDKSKWKEVKQNQPKKVELLLDLFSDVVWDKIINKYEFLEFSTPDQLFLFEILEKTASVIILKVEKLKIDLKTSSGFQWVLDHIDSDQVTIYHGSRPYTSSRNDFVYDYLKKGAVQSEGKCFKALETYFSNSSK
ncbi:MAG: hypothetical protein CBC08_03530 [Flavobacteriaceae bacterium TMED48]|nr:MAG: hypothetical protein CBC08_03530 [Flavobacteriaceae bacterium TMED48]